MYKFTYDPVMIFPFFADESMSQSGCYCCNPVPAGMDVDSALHELGMISSVTNSRREYLRERNRHTRAKELTQSSRFKIVQIDPTYVTGFSSSTSTDPGSPFTSDKDSNRSAHSIEFGTAIGIQKKRQIYDGT